MPLDHNINPDEWTLEELVKHTYREILELKKELLQLNEEGRSQTKVNNSKITNLEFRVKLIEEKLEGMRNNKIESDNRKDRRVKRWEIWLLVVTMLAGGIAYALEKFKIL